MNRGLKWLFAVVSVAIISPGCSESAPESKKAASSRQFVEHPLDAVGGEKPPQKPLSPKVKAALEKAKTIDPRNR